MTTVPNDPTRPQDELTELGELVETGTRALKSGDLDTAREAFETAAARFSGEPAGQNNLGAFYMGLGEHAAAEACFERVVELLPENLNCRFNLALARFKQQKHAAAAADFAHIAAADPQDAEARNNLGASRFLAGEVERAREDLIAALQLQPNYPNAVLNLCDLEVACGNADGAKGLCLAYLEHHRDLGVMRRLLELVDGEAAASLAAEG